MKQNTIHPSDVPLWMWTAIALILLTQGTWLFIDARKRDSNYWLWGVWGLVNFPLPLVCYFIFSRKIFHK